MDLTTTYMGLELKNPVVAAASPLSKDIDTAKQMEEAGASAIVMYSLFEEQILHEKQELDHFLASDTDAFAEALSYFPEPEEYHNIDAEDYLRHIEGIKKVTQIPVIGSLNGVSEGGWMEYAKKMEDAGADGLELNIYYVPTDPKMTSEQVEQLYVNDLKAVKSAVKIPVAMKLGPFFSSFGNMATKLDENGADALVIFNRFYAPDIDLENLEVVPDLKLSTGFEMRLPLRWIAILRGHVKGSLVASTGMYEADDVIKMLMAGADVTQLASTLLKKGIPHITKILKDMEQWMQEHDHNSVKQMIGSMSYKSIAEPAAYERANYMKMLQSW